MVTKMNKPILNVVYISLACIIGFIGGIEYGVPSNKKLAIETVTQHNEIQKLMSWYELILSNKSNIESLNEMKNIEDIEKTILKRKENGLTHIRLFRKQANRIKKNAPNPEAIIVFEKSVNEMEHVFK